jgi:hypothetical protein
VSNGIVAVEDASNLLESRALRLDVKQVNDQLS